MIREKASSNVSFTYLSGSSDFLNVVLNTLSSCVVMLNSNMELQAYNDALKTIFSNKKNEDILYQRCGEVIGCAYSVDEKTDCGTTSQCQFCELRVSAIEAYHSKKTIYKDRIDREFYTFEGQKELKHLQFSIRPFQFEKEYYLILIIDDITRLTEQKKYIDRFNLIQNPPINRA